MMRDAMIDFRELLFLCSYDDAIMSARKLKKVTANICSKNFVSNNSAQITS
jgi:hypothetical protein